MVVSDLVLSAGVAELRSSSDGMRSDARLLACSPISITSSCRHLSEEELSFPFSASLSYRSELVMQETVRKHRRGSVATSSQSCRGPIGEETSEITKFRPMISMGYFGCCCGTQQQRQLPCCARQKKVPPCVEAVRAQDAGDRVRTFDRHQEFAAWRAAAPFYSSFLLRAAKARLLIWADTTRVKAPCSTDVEPVRSSSSGPNQLWLYASF